MIDFILHLHVKNTLIDGDFHDGNLDNFALLDGIRSECVSWSGTVRSRADSYSLMRMWL